MLIVIPARGGSKTVRRKNLQPVAGKPLFLHVAETARRTFPNALVVVSTDDREIESVARVHGFDLHQRSTRTAGDEATIDQVVAEVAADLAWDGLVLMIQPTVPQIAPEQLTAFVELFEDSNDQVWAMGTEHRHITWTSGYLLTERVNRQENIEWPTNEIGVRIYRNRVGPPEYLHPVAGITDIDTWADLEEVRRQMRPATVLFRFRANKQTGAGHLHRCLALASELQQHRVILRASLDSEDWAIAPLAGWDTGTLPTGGSVVVVNDLLDTTVDDVLPWTKLGAKVVNLEDHGTGGRYADLVINALYHPRQEDENGRYLYGPKWAVLRPEFLYLPAFEIRTEHPKVLGLFGGTDPNRLGDMIESMDIGTVKVVRPGDDVSVAAEMMTHDILVTSAGRTVYEAAAVGIPTVVLAQNAREASHAHLGDANIYMGLGVLSSQFDIHRTVAKLWDNPELRRELSARSRKMVDGLGARRIAHRINGLLEEL